MESKKPQTVDEYIASFPPDMQQKLQQVRQTVRKAAPDAEETIGYGLATYKLHGNLVHFGGFKSHIGFYPAPRGIEAFKDELSKYKGAKGSVQFPADEPMPLDLIKRMVVFRVKENMELQSAKQVKKALAKKAAPKKAAKKNSK